MTYSLQMQPALEITPRATDRLTEEFFGYHVLNGNTPDVYIDWLEQPTSDPAEMDDDNPWLVEAREQMRLDASRRREQLITQQKTQADNIRKRAKMTNNPLVLDGLALIAREQGLYNYVSKVIAANDRRIADRIRHGVAMRDSNGASYWVTSPNFYKKLWKQGFREVTQCPVT